MDRGFWAGNWPSGSRREGHKAITLSRRPSGAGNQVAWQPDGSAGALPRHLDGVDAIVNLAGEGIADKRWTAGAERRA